MKKNALLILGILVANWIHAQMITDSLLIDGNYRTFHFTKPVNGKSGAALMFILHGSGGNGRQMVAGTTRLQAMSSVENLLLVYPDGYKHYWNECRKAANSAANLENIDENSFFHQMIRYFTNRYGINPAKVFAAGLSGGGHMAYKLALTMPDKFKAITAIVANLPDENNFDCVATGKPVPVMIINGTNDPVNPYGGGEVKISGAYLGNVRSTDKTFQYWANLAGYSGKPEETDLPDRDPADGKTIVRYRYKKKHHPEVILLKVIGGRHDYPNDIDTYVEAWEFFKRQ